MAYQQLISSFSKSRAMGITDDQLRQEAAAAGWTSQDIDAAFAAIAAQPQATAPAQAFVVPTTPATPPVQTFSQTAPPVQAFSSMPSQPISSTPVQAFSQTPLQAFTQAQAQKDKKRPIMVVTTLLILLIGAGAAYAYVERMGPFARAPYQEDNLMSGLFAKISEINSSTYSVSARLYAMERDADAVPFDIEIKDDKELLEKYYRDSLRADEVSEILRNLQYMTYDDKAYPATLAKVKSWEEGFGSPVLSVNDPLTKKEYSYKLISGGKDYELAVTFETSQALSQIKKSAKYSDNEPKIDGMTVTFSKDSYSYLYLPSEPPKTFFESMGDFAAYLPPEIDVSGTVSATSEKAVDGGIPKWKFMMDGTGNFGDLSYKINLEALKGDADYYLRINNMPSLFSSFLPPKGQWVKFSPETADQKDEQDPYSASFMTSESIAEYEEKYKEQKDETVAFIKKVVTFADEEKLFTFKSVPKREKVEDGRSLYRYDLQVRKEAVLPFYRKLIDEVARMGESGADYAIIDEGYLNFLESDEFSETFDYYDRNIDVTMWTDDDGFPALFKYSIRIVPKAEVVTLAGKQIILEFTISLDDINKPVEIKIPEEAKTYEELMGQAGTPLGEARIQGQAAVTKANLSNLRAQSELVYDNVGGYGTKAFPLGTCANTSGTLFGDTMVFQNISDATEQKPETGMCYSGYGSDGKLSVYAVAVPLPGKPDYSYCVDSSGAAREILGILTKTSCAY